MSVMLIDALSARQGGGQTYLLNLLTRLPPGEPSMIYLLAPREVGEQVKSERVRLLQPEWPVRNGLARTVWEKLFLRRHAARLGASVIFFPGGVVASSAPGSSQQVTMFRNVIPFDPAQRAKYPVGYQRLRNWALERVMLKSMLEADLVIFLSNYGRSLIERRAGRAIPGAATIPHGISPVFRAPPSGAKLDWLPDHPYLLYVSSFEPYKAQLEVVRAFARVMQEWKDPLSLVLVGPHNTPYARRVTQEIRSQGLEGRVLMPGNKRYGDLPAAHHHSLIGIFASEAENCPNALLEAMAAGKPILCSSRPPMPEFGGKAVWYFDPSSVEELSGKLLRLLREPATRERLGAAAAEWSRRFDWDQTARATWSALRKLEQSGQPLIVHAPNVHVGGGRELLAALVQSLDGRHPYSAVLDERFAREVDVRHAAEVVRVRPTMVQRLAAELRLRALARRGSRVLCFGNLPPLFRLPAQVFLYLQNRYLTGNHSLIGLPARMALRLAIERWWLASRLKNVDTIVVQTATMQLEVRERFGRDAIVLPFLPQQRAHAADSHEGKERPSGAFLYVASGEPHKNHRCLLQAWIALARAGLRPPLWLTLDAGRYGQLVREIDARVSGHGLNIVNLGNLSREGITDAYHTAAALIYPSTLESYGLPLLEARAAGLPILTGELDYVRDVVDPEETFDPHSALSIARAVRRFLKRAEQRAAAASADEFVHRLIAASADADPTIIRA